MIILLEFILNNCILRHASRETGLLQLFWQLLRAGATYGFATTSFNFTEIEGDYTVEMIRHYWADVFPALGVKDLNNGDVYIREWWKKSDIQKLLKRSKNEFYNHEWNKEGLKSLLSSSEKTKESDEVALLDQEAGVQESGYEVIKLYNGEKITVFTADGFLLREQEVTWKGRGIRSFYYDTDGENVYGQSLVSLIGGQQNFIDMHMQAKGYVTMIESDPMIIVKGGIPKKIKIKPHSFLPLSLNGEIDTLKFSTPSLNNYSADHILGQSSIYNLVNNNQTNISAGASIGQGKTPKALAMQSENKDVDDNFIRENIKLFLSKAFSEMLNIYFANMPDQFILEVTPEYATRLRNIDPALVTSSNEVLVDNNDYVNYEYEVDIETSRVQDRSQQLDGYSRLLEAVRGDNTMSQRLVASGAYDLILKGIVQASGAPDSEEIISRLDQFNEQSVPQVNPLIELNNSGVAPQIGMV
jgi:hypothetical protein